MKLFACLLSTVVLMFVPGDGRNANRDKTGTLPCAQNKESSQTPEIAALASL